MEFKVFSKFFFSNSNYTQKLRNKEEGDPEEFTETMKKKKIPGGYKPLFS